MSRDGALPDGATYKELDEATTTVSEQNIRQTVEEVRAEIVNDPLKWVIEHTDACHVLAVLLGIRLANMSMVDFGMKARSYIDQLIEKEACCRLGIPVQREES